MLASCAALEVHRQKAHEVLTVMLGGGLRQRAIDVAGGGLGTEIGDVHVTQIVSVQRERPQGRSKRQALKSR